MKSKQQSCLEKLASLFARFVGYICKKYTLLLADADVHIDSATHKRTALRNWVKLHDPALDVVHVVKGL